MMNLRTVPVTAQQSLILNKQLEEVIMSDDLNNRGAQDRRRISLAEPHEVRYWTKALGVDFDELKRVVDKVGHSTEAVRKELGK